MAKPSSCIAHVEAFVDTASPAKDQAAAVDVIAALVKSDLLTLEELVREMELYLTTSDHITRARGILLLAEVLSHLTSKPLDNTSISSLTAFFTSRLADWQALRGALVGCLALLRRKSNVGMIVARDARSLAQSYLTNVQVQSLAVHDRKLCFEVLQCLLDFYPDAITTLGDDLVYGICEAIDEEKDPRCLILTFHIVEILGRLFPDPSGSVASFAEELFEILGRYFPIYFTHPRSENVEIKRDDLSRALMHAFCSTPFFEPFAIPLLIEKLSSTLQSEKLDSLNYLNNCILHYGAERMFKHAKTIWSTLKAVIFAHSSFSLTSESVGNIDSRENEIALAALNCLQTATLQLNYPDSDIFINLILDDDDVENYFVSLSAVKSHSDISKESLHRLRALGNILLCSSKISRGCCSKVLQKFFPRLMNILGVSGCSSSDGCATNNKIYSKTLSFGALYLCVELLDSCRHLTVAAQDISPQVQDIWFNLLQDFAGPLTCALGSTLARCASSVASEETYGPEHVLYGVKGFGALAMFPESCSPVSDDVYEDILGILMSVIVNRSDETLLWKLSLKAVVEIGSFIEKFHDSKKGIIYNRVVVERIVSLLLLDDSTVPLALKLEATSEIGVTGLEFMLRVARGLEEAIFSNLSQAYVDENSKSAEALVPLLQCYCTKVLPWCHKSAEFEEVAMHFAVNIWNQMESVSAFAVDPPRQGLLETTMIAMKFAVGDCTEENQALILQKAFSILSSTTCLSLESVLFSSSKLEWLQLLPSLSVLSHKDECLLSLFASAIIALRPQTPLPDARILFKLFMVFLLKGHVPAAQALASMINKWPASISREEVAGASTLEEAIDVTLEILFNILGRNPVDKQNFLDSSEQFLSYLYPSSIQTHAVVGLAWIGKGLLMRGHERVKEIAMFLLKCLVSSQSSKITPLHGDESENAKLQDVNAPVARAAADAFFILLSDSDFCLNKKFHATIRPLCKQRFFSIMMPVLLSSIKESSSSCTRAVLYRAFGHVICGTPLPALVAEAKKVIPPLLGCLSALSPDISNKDMIYNLLLILSGILVDENGKEAIMENVHTIISDLIKLISYPHMLLVRETAIQCLVAISGLPHTRIYPMRPQVLRALSKSLDDPKRAVRQEAVRCRQAWASIASRSLHF